jgi:hypothetical protein
MNTRTLFLNLAPLAGRGRRVAPGEGVQVSRQRYSRREPLTPPLSPQERGEGAQAVIARLDRAIQYAAAYRFNREASGILDPRLRGDDGII